MILARLIRQQQPLRAAARCSVSLTCRPIDVPSCVLTCRQQRISQASQRRSVVTVPKLENTYDTFSEKGIGQDRVFMSAEGFQTAYTDYMMHLETRLNKLVPDKAQYDNKGAQAVVVLSARNPADAAIFNFASAMFNNHFFFKTLSPTTQVEMPGDFAKSINDCFGGVDNLRSEMLATAFHMFGPGYVWLVWHRPTNGGVPEWKILATYLAGSPLSDAHWRQQAVNMTTENIASAKDVLASAQEARAKQAPGGSSQHTTAQNNVSFMGKHSSEGKKQATRAPGGADVTPVLCVSTWEHAWLPTHGIQGKAKYLARWWDHIDWHAVSKAWPRVVKKGADGKWMFASPEQQ